MNLLNVAFAKRGFYQEGTGPRIAERADVRKLACEPPDQLGFFGVVRRAVCPEDIVEPKALWVVLIDPGRPWIFGLHASLDETPGVPTNRRQVCPGDRIEKARASSQQMRRALRNFFPL